MNEKQAIYQRHTVRNYTNQPLTDEDMRLLNERIEKLNHQFHLDMKLMVNHKDGLGVMGKVFFSKTVKNYLILAGDKREELDELLGYASADWMIYAQSIGLNTWYIGGLFHQRVRQYVGNKKVIGVIAIGYGRTQGTPHSSKTKEEVSTYEGDMPEWFIKGIEGALLAPTAYNKQDFFITGRKNEVSIEVSPTRFGKVNKGLVKYHFEFTAEKENFVWK